MTQRDRITQALHEGDGGVEKLLRLAYYMGATAVARRVCDEHTARLARMRAAADKVRYHHQAHAIISAGLEGRRDGWTVAGDKDAIYDGDYAGDYPDTFGGDPVPGEVTP